ncbi:hypothetical protein CEV31_0060 [Brucella thiophenivorans]|uniref:Uncharacterized protein n=1 Tax=Brucella thiophenivorans TaxID=571255 RepID=A0A256G7E2_9HYPH|nr:hypothetical protein CEV31_0060 [Brucella thiophenivorans]
MPTAVFNDDAITALAFNKRHDIGFSKVTFKDNQITFPVTELQTIANKIRMLMNKKCLWNAGTARSSGAAWAAFCSHLSQVFIQLQRVFFL